MTIMSNVFMMNGTYPLMFIGRVYYIHLNWYQSTSKKFLDKKITDLFKCLNVLKLLIIILFGRNVIR